MYSAMCTDAEGGTCDITFVVKPAPAERSRIAVLANANTWLAYNGWGGQSKYSGLARTSFLRPMPGAAPGADMHLTRGELWILGWLEREGFRPDVYSDLDFHNDGCDAAQYACLVVGTHPEYWTTQMYDNAAAYLDAGGSLLYIAGNGIFEVGEYDNEPDRDDFPARNRGRAARGRPLPPAGPAGTLTAGCRDRTLRCDRLAIRRAVRRSRTLRRNGRLRR